MKIKVVDQTGKTYEIDIDPTDNIFQLKAKVSSKMGGVSVHSLKASFNGKELEDFSNLIQNQIKEGDTVYIKGANPPPQAQPQQQQNPFAAFGGNAGFQAPAHSNVQAQALGEAQKLRDHYAANTSELNMLLERDPELAQAILSDDVNDTVNMIIHRRQKARQEQMRRAREEMQLDSDPWNVDKQREIEKRIHEERHNKNLEYAQEYLPESFIQTTMLYIEMEINKVKFQAFVDSGAQSTIISKAFAERCGLLKDIDTRFEGRAVGVGSSKILGRIHSASLKIADKHWVQCSLQVLESIDIDFLFGLDMLKKHRCNIDLLNNCLRFTQENVEVRFLGDHEIKKSEHRTQKGGEVGGLQGAPKVPTNEEKETMIKTLEDLGASKEQATQLLQRTGWNAELAASAFYEMMGM